MGGGEKDVSRSENHKWAKWIGSGEKWGVAAGSGWVWIKLISSLGF